jgi:hypothetical protein
LRELIEEEKKTVKLIGSRNSIAGVETREESCQSTKQ